MKPNNREFFIEHIDQFLIGPGANDIINSLGKQEELLDNYPLQVYYSGILFPEIEQIKTVGEIAETNSLTDNSEKEVDENPQDNNENEGKEWISKKQEIEQSNSEANNYFPSNNGLTFCINKETNLIKVAFSAGVYENVYKKNKSQIKIKIEKSDFEKLKASNPEYQFPFEENIGFEPINDVEGFLF